MSKTGIIIGIIVVIVLLVAGFFVLQNQAHKPSQEKYPVDTNNQINQIPTTSTPAASSGDPALNALTADSQTSEPDDSSALSQEDPIATPSG